MGQQVAQLHERCDDDDDKPDFRNVPLFQEFPPTACSNFS